MPPQCSPRWRKLRRTCSASERRGTVTVHLRGPVVRTAIEAVVMVGVLLLRRAVLFCAATVRCRLLEAGLATRSRSGPSVAVASRRKKGANPAPKPCGPRFPRIFPPASAATGHRCLNPHRGDVLGHLCPRLYERVNGRRTISSPRIGRLAINVRLTNQGLHLVGETTQRGADGR